MREYKITATVKHMDWDEPVTYIYNLLHWLDTRECLRWSYYKWFNDEREV